MQILQPRWMALAAVSISIALIPQLAAIDPEKPNATESTVQHDPQPSADDVRASAILQSLLLVINSKVLQRSHVEPRSPLETPPTEYLPYPPPPNYSWPPGPHSQYPPPSETNAPAGWYGGTGTGGQGNSGAGSSSGNSYSSSAPSLRIPSPLLLPFNILITFLPSSLLPPVWIVSSS